MAKRTGLSPVVWRNTSTGHPPPCARGRSSLLVRALIWDLIGGLDERFYPVYMVDIDLAMAIRKLGFVVICQPNSCVRHHQAASSTPSFRDFLLYRNQRLFIKKWGAALENHEPFENSPAAIERALARAEVFADECRRRSNMTTEYPVWPTALNAADQNFRYAKKSRALKRAYIRHCMLTKPLRYLLGKPLRYLRKRFRGEFR